MQRQALVERQSANLARAYPKLSVNGNFGGIGRSIGGVQATGLIQGQIDFTIFDRDRQGEAQELAAQVKSIDDRIADLRRGIDEDIREALLNLDSAAAQVEVAGEGQELARRELAMAQDRFEQGTANNVEVVTAQDELARAEQNYILAVTSHVDAKFALARALGDTQKNIAGFVETWIIGMPLWNRRGSSHEGLNDETTHTNPDFVSRRNCSGGVLSFLGYQDSANPNLLTLSGNIEAHESLVGFKVQGRIVDLPVEEGEQVEHGVLLARLENADLHQKVRVDEAGVRVRESDLALTLAGTRVQEIKASRQNMLDAQADMEQKRIDNVRAQNLFAKDEVSAQDRDLAATAFKRAQAVFRAGATTVQRSGGGQPQGGCCHRSRQSQRSQRRSWVVARKPGLHDIAFSVRGRDHGSRG